MNLENNIPDWVWWKLGIDPRDQAEWPLMSQLAPEVLQFYLQGGFDEI